MNIIEEIKENLSSLDIVEVPEYSEILETKKGYAIVRSKPTETMYFPGDSVKIEENEKEKIILHRKSKNEKFTIENRAGKEDIKDRIIYTDFCLFYRPSQSLINLPNLGMKFDDQKVPIRIVNLSPAKDCEKNGQISFDTDDFVKAGWYTVLDRLDAYNSSVMLHNSGKRFAIYNTYGDESSERHYELEDGWCHVFTPCVIWEDKHTEVGDIQVKPSTKEFRIDNYLAKGMPEELKFIDFNAFAGKRAFYYYPKRKKISFSIREELYNNIPGKYKYKKAEEWCSGPRIII